MGKCVRNSLLVCLKWNDRFGREAFSVTWCWRNIILTCHQISNLRSMCSVSDVISSWIRDECAISSSRGINFHTLSWIPWLHFSLFDYQPERGDTHQSYFWVCDFSSKKKEHISLSQLRFIALSQCTHKILNNFNWTKIDRYKTEGYKLSSIIPSCSFTFLGLSFVWLSDQ